MGELLSGFKYVFSGFRLIKGRGVKRYVILPILINTFLFTGVIVWGASLLHDLIDNLANQWSWLNWIAWLLWPLFMFIVFAVVFFGFSMVANLIGAPFNGLLAEAVEDHLTGESGDRAVSLQELLAVMGQSIVAEGHKLLYFSIRALPLLVLFAVPLLQSAAPVLWLLFGAWMLAMEYLDYPMANHGILFPEIRQRLGHRRSLVLGFGLGVMLITMIPVVNFVAMPVAVAGATRLWMERVRALPGAAG